MAKFQIKYALGGGFGGVDNKDWETIEAKDLSDAENQAYDLACLEYESYEGSNGLRTLTDIMEDEGVDADEAEAIWLDERESWLDYVAREYKEDE